MAIGMIALASPAAVAQWQFDEISLKTHTYSVSQKVMDIGNIEPDLDEWIQISQLDWDFSFLSLGMGYMNELSSGATEHFDFWIAPNVFSKASPLKDYDWVPYQQGRTKVSPRYGDLSNRTHYSASPDTQLNLALGVEYEHRQQQWDSGAFRGILTIGVDSQFIDLDAYGLDAIYSEDSYRDRRFQLPDSRLGISQYQLYSNQYAMMGLVADFGPGQIYSDFGLGASAGMIYDYHHLRDKETFTQSIGMQANASLGMKAALSDTLWLSAEAEIRRSYNIGIARSDFYQADGNGSEAPPGSVTGYSILGRPASVIDYRLDSIVLGVNMNGKF